MKETAKYFYLAGGLALAVAFGLAIHLLGGDRLMTLALILVSGLAVAVVVGTSALPIRAWKRRDMTGETHHIHDGTRTVIKETRVLDGRTVEAPKLYQLPAAQGQQFFPELLRASYQAGLLADRRASEPAVDAEVRELEPDGWDGDITQ